MLNSKEVGEKMIEVRGLSKSFDKVSVIDDLSFQIEDGEIIGVFGVKDAGKSLLLKMLVGIIKPDAGDIIIDGRPIANNSMKDIAYVSNERGIFYDMTPMEHMQYLRYYYPRFNEDVFKQYMEYFQVPLNAPMDKLKYDEIEKLDMCLALAKNTRIMILDDPFRRETPKNRKQYIKTMISNTKKDRIILIAARNAQGMKDLVDRALVLEK